MNWIDERIKEYYAWMKDNTFIKQDSDTGWYAISTPFASLFNDNIEIFAKKEKDSIILSDDGATISNLKMLGVDIARSPKRKEIIDAILRNYGISIKDEELYAETSEIKFPQTKHGLISAISEISDLEYMAKHTIASVFKEDVGAFLDEQDIIYTPQFIIKGSTGLDFCFDYLIAGKKTELVIKPFNSLTQGMVERFLFSWTDIKDARQIASKKELLGLAVINDSINEPKQELIEALKSKNAKVMLWSKRGLPEYRDMLKAS
ncbi:DUF1828 domain-containing protein [Parabacteroides bouchesdurhonensis]|uniref:DUF1828 domain-containing protein n=1 Tax=Parabacteroides bouchesdurhonensis TaxID=1936995 RepID=UPI000C8652FC|nr:DUF1828 domain-containing protein [Parabacteroides bouchesdurhonensis]